MGKKKARRRSPGKKPDKTLRATAKRESPKQRRVSMHQNLFVRAIASTGFISEAARAVGMSRQQHYEWLRKDPTYRQRVEDAKADYLDVLTLECDRRAVEGVRTPIVNGSGEVVGYRVIYSDELLMFRLKMIDPSYRDGFKVNPMPMRSRNDDATLNSPKVRELCHKIAELIGGGKESQ